MTRTRTKTRIARSASPTMTIELTTDQLLALADHGALTLHADTDARIDIAVAGAEYPLRVDA